MGVGMTPIAANDNRDLSFLPQPPIVGTVSAGGRVIWLSAGSAPASAEALARLFPNDHREA